MCEEYRHLHRAIALHKAQFNTAPSAWVSHIPFAFWIVDALQPRVLVELGTEGGTSYCAFCQAVDELKIATACYAVDTWEGDAHSGFYDETVFSGLAAYHNARYAGFSSLIRSSFDAAVGHFSDRSVDLLHIDGYHTYEAVKHDFDTWRPKLSPRGVVLFHDTNVRSGDFGVWRFWGEVAQSYPGFEFLHGYGLGVLAVGDEMPEPLRWLVRDRASAPHETAEIREFFARLGQVTSDEAELCFRLGQLTGDAAEFLSRLAKLRSDERALSIREQVMQRRLEDVLSSASWRVTAPLRRLKQLLSRISPRA